MRILFYGFGNPGRRDDGLGVLFTEELERWCKENNVHHIAFDSNYQLNIEDAHTIRDYDLVIFCDASQEDIRAFCFTEVMPSDTRIEFSMHAVSPAFVLDISKKLFDKTPATWLLHIKGYDWEFREGLSPESRKNLNAALDFIKEKLIPSPDPLSILKQSDHSCP